jgi:hypothetical protein
VISERSESRRLRADARLVEQVVLQRLLADNIPQIIEIFELEILNEKEEYQVPCSRPHHLEYVIEDHQQPQNADQARSLGEVVQPAVIRGTPLDRLDTILQSRAIE